MTFMIKRAYEPATAADGTRVLIDRLWPRGLKKSAAHLTHWMKDLAPSTQLRGWFSHRPERFEKFSRRYESELSDNPGVPALRKLGKGKPVTLIYAARDPKINHARVLLAVLRGRRLKVHRKPA